MDNSDLYVNLDDIVDWNDISGNLNEVLSTLTGREEKVLRIRFGLDGQKPKSLEETGVIFNVTKERIRQIEAKALRKLRHPSRSKKVRDYVNCTLGGLAPQKYTRYVVTNKGLDIYPKTKYEDIENEELGEFDEMFDEIDNSKENTFEGQEVSNAQNKVETEQNVLENNIQEEQLDESIKNYETKIEAQTQVQQVKQNRLEKLQVLESLMKKSKELRKIEHDIDEEIAELERSILRKKDKTREDS